LADLPESFQLLQGLGEFARALLDLALQIGIGFPDLGSHAVELIGEGLKFVTRSYLDPLVQRPRADPGCSGLQHLDRGDHPAGEQ
jgi:hypothetical protein